MGLLTLGRRFHVASPWDDCPFDRDSFLMTIVRMIDDSQYILLVDGGDEIAGMLGAVIYPCWFNRHHLIVQELFWWSERPSKLREEMEKKAKESEASFVAMQALENERKPAMERLYRKHGYVPIEQLYLKGL